MNKSTEDSLAELAEYYECEYISPPLSKQDGLLNALEIIKRSICSGDSRDALLQIVALQDDLKSGLYSEAKRHENCSPVTASEVFESGVSYQIPANESQLSDLHKRGHGLGWY